MDVFLNASRGHRETWAMFNQMPLDVGRAKGYAYHKTTDAAAMTKRELRELVETQEHLVQEITSFGSDIPTTSMFWKRETNRLEWVVRQMSWCPPWVSRAEDDAEEFPLIHRRPPHASVEVTAPAARLTHNILPATSGELRACDAGSPHLASGAEAVAEVAQTVMEDEDVLV